jgi:hypothetical protein
VSGGRGIDHLVLPVRDLEAAAAHYGRLGFTVGTRNRHPWGTENRLIQLPHCFLELIAEAEAPPGAANGFSTVIGRFLKERGEGMALLALESGDAAGDEADLRAAGVGGADSLYFEREGRGPSGEPVRVAFTLAFASSPLLPGAGVFLCQQHEPQNFWAPALWQHENGARTISGVILAADDPRATLSFLETVAGVSAACVGARNIALVTPRGSIEAMTPDCFRDVVGVDAALTGTSPVFAAFKVAAPVEAMAARLEGHGIAHHRHRRHLVIPAESNHGVALVVEEPRP